MNKMSKLAKVKEEAFNYLAKGKWDKALRAYVTLTQLDPKEPKNYQKVAELRAKLGQKKEAVNAYKQACEVYMSRGFLLQAIAMCKMVVQLDPSEREMEQRLATLYSQRGIGATSQPTAPLGSAPPVPKSSPPSSKTEVKPEPPKPKPSIPSQPHTQPENQPVAIEQEEAGTDVKKIPVWDIPMDTEEDENAPEVLKTTEKKTDYFDESSSKKSLPDTIEPEEVESELPPLDVPLEPGEPLVSSELPPLMDDELPMDETLSPLQELETISNTRPTTVQQAEESFDIDVMGGEEEDDEEELPEIKEETVGEKTVPSSKPSVQPPVYDLSAEMEKSPEDIKELLEEEWEEEAEEILTQPPEESVLEEADIEDMEFFPEIPLFKDLGKDEFESVLKKLKAVSFQKGDLIVKEGEEGDSILIIVSGSVSVYKEMEKGKKIQLGILSEGDFFGEFGYFAGSVRQASVEALDDVELLEITRENMDAVIADYPQVEEVLEKFYKERVMQNVLATSPLFRELSLEERCQIAAYFKLTEVREGKNIVVEGEEGDSMYFIRSGEVMVHTVNPMGEKIHLAELKAGDFFGEVSLIQGKPRTATVTASSPVVELMQLKKNDLDTILETHPEILDKLNEVITKRVSDTVNKVSILDLEDEDLELGSLL